MIIIVDRVLSKIEEQKVLESKKNNIKCFQTYNFLDSLEKLSISNDFRNQKLDEFLSKIVNFPHSFFGNKTINEIYNYNGIKLFYYHKFRIFNNLKDSFVLSEYLKCNFKNDKIIIYSDKESIEKFIESTNDVTTYKGYKKQNKADKYKTILKYASFVTIRYFISLFRNYNLKNVKHLFIDNTKPIKLLDKNLKLTYNNVVFSYLYDKLDRKSLIFNVIDIPKNYKDLKFRKYFFINPRKNVKTYYYEKAFINNFSFKEYKNIIRKLKIINDELTDISTTSIDVCDKIILNKLISLNKSTAFYLIRQESIKRFFKKNSFINITAYDENGTLAKSIFDVAKILNIKTFGVQHAGIGKYSVSYIYSTKDKTADAIPFKTYVWGDYWKNFLVNLACYSNKNIEVFGQIRTDIIPIIKEKISEDETTILFASQPIPDKNYRYRAAVDIMNFAKKNPQLKIIIKLHHNEFDGKEYYKQIANKFNVLNYEISTNDLYMLIAKSKIVITCFSTVGAEAVYFKKPLIIIDYNKEDLLGFIKEKVAFEANDFDSLNENAHGILSNKIKINIDDINKFIKNYAHSIDGNVSERILNSIINNGE